MAGRGQEVDTRPSSRVGLRTDRCRRYAKIDTNKKSGGWSWWYLLFVLQFAVALWPPFYNKVEPTMMGMPFFYWFQLFWVIVSAIFTAIIYFAVKE